MALRFYMDVHIRRSITEGLRKKGVDVVTAQEDNSAELSDPELLARASELSRVLFSMDEKSKKVPATESKKVPATEESKKVPATNGTVVMLYGAQSGL